MREAQQLYDSFRSRVEQDLTKWTDRRDREQQTLLDYERTLEMVETQDLPGKLQVDLGGGFFMQACRPTDRMVLRVLGDSYIEVTMPQAKKLLPELIALHKQRLASTKREVAFIMAAEEELRLTLQRLSTSAS